MDELKAQKFLDRLGKFRDRFRPIADEKKEGGFEARPPESWHFGGWGPMPDHLVPIDPPKPGDKEIKMAEIGINCYVVAFSTTKKRYGYSNLHLYVSDHPLPGCKVKFSPLRKNGYSAARTTEVGTEYTRHLHIRWDSENLQQIKNVVPYLVERRVPVRLWGMACFNYWAEPEVQKLAQFDGWDDGKKSCPVIRLESIDLCCPPPIPAVQTPPSGIDLNHPWVQKHFKIGKRQAQHIETKGRGGSHE